MAVTLTPVAGVLVEVSAAAPATFDETGYNALTFTPVGGFDQVPDLGDAYEDQSFDSVTDGRIPYRGILDPGGGEFGMADDPADAGQVILKGAFDAAKGSAAEKISMRIRDETGAYTAAQVMVSSWRRSYGGSNDIVRRNVTIRAIPGTVTEGTET